MKQVITKLKLDFGGHDLLFNEEIRLKFLSELNNVIESSPFSVIATAIDKRNLKKDYPNSDNPYLIAWDSAWNMPIHF